MVEVLSVYANVITVLTAVFPAPLTKQLESEICWELRSAGLLVRRKERVGPTYRLAIPEYFIGKRIEVTPYVGSHHRGRTHYLDVRAPDSSLFTVPSQSFQISVRSDEDKKWWGAVNGTVEFFVGQEVRWRDGRGLQNQDDPLGPKYDRASAAESLGYWASLIFPTAVAESRCSFCAVNTYDVARFTFGFWQFAAHTPGENFVVLLRKLLALPEAGIYLPTLTVNAAGRVTNGEQVLEDHSSTSALMAFFNASLKAVDESEVALTATLIHWTRASAAARQTQLDLAIRKAKSYLAAKRADLDGRSLLDCALVLDIAHHGRAGEGGYAKRVRPALQAKRPLEALLEIGLKGHESRVESLRESIGTLSADRHLADLHYSAEQAKFITRAPSAIN